MMSNLHVVDQILNNGSLGEINAEVSRLEKLNLDMPTVSIHIIRNYTVEPLVPFLKLQLYKRGLVAKISVGDYDVLEQSFIAPILDKNVVNADIVVISLHLDTFDIRNREIFWQSSEAISRLSKLLDMIDGKSRGVILINTFLRPQYSDVGITSSLLKNSRAHQVDKLNRIIENCVAANKEQFFLVDWNMLAAHLGAFETYDHRFWHTSRSPFKRGFLSVYGAEIAKVAAALKGNNKKVLALDCDNTLWGGIVGEDGLSGIKLDPYEYPGNIYYAFQRNVLNLMSRGVMIVLNSKNNETDVFAVLEKHPHCLLRREHLSAWEINWSDKVSNLKVLAAKLNVSVDSFVFVDDSPMECNLVREYLPTINVIQVPAKIYEYPDILLADGWFDTLFFSSEDKTRTEMYQQELLRKQEAAQFESIADYLASLQIVATIHLVRPNEVARIAQLTQKTNQFNLTTLRLSEEELDRRVKNESFAVYTMRAKDRFGDYGLTALLVMCEINNKIVIENFLMSCRILGRNLEYRFVEYCLGRATQNWGIVDVTACYIPTAKNSQVENFWGNLGFQLDQDTDTRQYSARYDDLCFPLTKYIEITEG